MKFDVLTLFPGMFSGPLDESIIGRAAAAGLLQVCLHNIRDYAIDRHKTVDDAPYGGGAGMVMKIEPLAACIEHVKQESPNATVVLTTPRGIPFSQEIAGELALKPGLILICGRYEGVDERVSERFVDREISLGDFVLTGGELAAMIVIDAVGRLLPGVLGCGASAHVESFADGLLEYPQYTRPPEFQGLSVPDVLLSGNHREVERWRRRQSIRKTLEVRPDLLAAAELSKEEQSYLAQLREASND